MMNLKHLFSATYLLSTNTATKFEKYYLYAGVVILALTVGYRLFLFLRGNRPEIYRPFDRVWFWGFFTSGVLGIFIWFSRSQSLPLFSTRIISYCWILANLVLLAYLIYYYKKQIPSKLNKYYDKRRKQKYLNK